MPLCSKSYVNSIFWWKLLRTDNACSIDDNFITIIVLSIYRFQRDMCSIKVGINYFSNSTINIPAITGPKGDPIATPSHFWYISLLKVKCMFFYINLKVLLFPSCLYLCIVHWHHRSSWVLCTLYSPKERL